MISDIKTILWKELVEFRRNFTKELVLVVLPVFLIGIVIPINVLLSANVVLPTMWIFGAGLFMGTFLYSGSISIANFGAERRQYTLRMLLCTRLSPAIIFVGKWLWLLLKSGAAMILICAGQTVFSALLIPSSQLATQPDQIVILGVLFLVFSLMASAYITAVNTVVSLIIKDERILGPANVIAMLVAVSVLVGTVKVLGTYWYTLIVLGCCLLLMTAGALVAAVIAFRSEKIRL